MASNLPFLERTHPNTVTIFHIGDHKGMLFIVMEFVDGGSLEHLVQQTGPMLWPEATRAVRDAAAGLAEAHELGLVHRDVKPANLLRTSKGVTKIADFGLVREQAEDTGRRRAERVNTSGRARRWKSDSGSSKCIANPCDSRG